MITLAGAIIGAVALTSVAALTAPAAQARDRVALSIDLGDVRFGYADGYYDYWGGWHRWGPREAYAFRMSYAERYWDGPRGRYPNRGWRDYDRDGVPNRHDYDRDGDGVPNRYDRWPDNPWRD
ncbi:MAG: hypothetical protein JNM81_13230 [Rhodospirillaceae bacterium]|nr:hypothetical protein [Rhodospirillaceae bacterium]